MVEYRCMPGLPGRAFFSCATLHATLSVEACAANWRQSRLVDHEGVSQRASCRLCAIGAQHAGEQQASMSPLKGSLTCARCHRGALRLIGGHLCVSCKNREYELVRGRNAKGAAPVKLARLEPRRLRYLDGDAPRVIARPLTRDVDELIVAVLRDSENRVRFAYSAPARLAQASLF